MRPAEADDLGWSGQLVVHLLRLFPEQLRRDYGADLLATFLDQRDERIQRSRAPMLAALAVTARASWQIVKASVAERWVTRRQRRVRPPRGRSSTMLESLSMDVRYAVRGLMKQPGFTLTALLTLALGIGAITTIFSVVNGVLLTPLPFDEPDRLVGVWHSVNRGSGTYPLSPGTYFTYREENRVFEDLGLWKTTRLTVTGLEEPEVVDAMQVTDGTFSLLRVQPVLGRRFTATDDTRGTPLTVMLGNSYWRSRFGADPNVVGRTLVLNGVSVEIIGVLPERFRFLGHDPAVYLTFRFNPSIVGVGNFSFPGVARLRPGVTVEAANRDVARMLPLAPERYSRGPRMSELQEAGFGPDVHRLELDEIGNVGTTIWILFGTVGFVLLIACVNVANLFLVRAEARQREVAVRAALGAGRARLAMQFVTESLVLAVFGGLLGLGLAYAGLGLLVRLAPDTLPRLDAITLDPVVLIFTSIVAVSVGVIFGLFPVARMAVPNVAANLRGGGHGTSDGKERHRLRNLLAVSEVALALVLLIASGLMARSFAALLDVFPGFERPHDVLTFRLTVPSAEAPEDEMAALIHERILSRLGELPDVASVGAASSVTMDGFDSNNGIHVEEFPTPDGELAPLRRLKWVAGDYVATMGNRLVAGRTITWDDIYNRAPVAMVTENVAREHWGEPNRAIGKRIRDSSSEWHEIVGVVGNERDDGIDLEAPPIVYWPFVMPEFWGDTPFVWRTLSYAVRANHSDPASLVPRVREAIGAINPNLAISNVRTLGEIYDRSMARTTFTLVMLGIAAIIALALGVVGVYGVISFVVAQRTREMGVRVALGAQRGNVRMLVLRHGGTVALLGVGIGLAVAAGLTRFMASLLYGVNAADPMTFTAATVIVAGVAFLASYLPARRAATVDPMEALRGE